MARGYWNWVRHRQRPYLAGFRPPLLVLVSLFVLSALVTGPLGLLAGIAFGRGRDGFGTGLAVAFPVALLISAVAKHQAHRDDPDPWAP
ncbi:MAG: hypothetical protein M3O32_01255 [Actinomycetota bacterium]|nr:hypothetical protein [Actinomycetota bacterium]